MLNTIAYYEKNAKVFVEDTLDVDFTKIQNMFLELLPLDAYILDLGCGSGRDTKYFLEQGYRVDAIDGSKELCKAASKYTGINVKNMLFQELDEIEKYDGIWVCASLLHVKREELTDIFKKICMATKKMELSMFLSSMAISKVKEMEDILQI